MSAQAPRAYNFCPAPAARDRRPLSVSCNDCQAVAPITHDRRSAAKPGTARPCAPSASLSEHFWRCFCFRRYRSCTIVSAAGAKQYHPEVGHDQSECDVPQYARRPI